MYFEFTENSLIIIPFTYKGYRLSEGEKVRFKCLFKTKNGDLPYTQCIEEDNKRSAGSDGHYTITLDSKTKDILPGRYSFSLELVFASGITISLKTKSETGITIIPAPHNEECDCCE